MLRSFLAALCLALVASSAMAQVNTAAETRPRNNTLLPIIRYQ